MDDKKKLEISQKWQKRLNNCKKSVGVIKFNDIIFNLIFSNNRVMNQVVLKKKKNIHNSELLKDVIGRSSK